MESNRKLRGFIKGKLMPFYKATPKSAPPTVPYSNNVKPPSHSSTAYLVQQDYLQIPQPKKMSFVVPAAAADNANWDMFSQFDKLSGGAAADESVDAKATTYISSVQERFKLRTNQL
ncbi:hypothetical protein SLEP1_g48231 [Rubroshorea leprosula]|uniref:Uncharacterized protein n=1 Tax=Rubroshorea leprosula TaxID=152421 RepID=A0AAV5LSZ1_9ROSI|nr:hypothetical protein SLEP1_g48231 [Rubroshorea leprosula]